MPASKYVACIATNKLSWAHSCVQEVAQYNESEVSGMAELHEAPANWCSVAGFCWRRWHYSAVHLHYHRCSSLAQDACGSARGARSERRGCAPQQSATSLPPHRQPMGHRGLAVPMSHQPFVLENLSSFMQLYASSATGGSLVRTKSAKSAAWRCGAKALAKWQQGARCRTLGHPVIGDARICSSELF